MRYSIRAFAHRDFLVFWLGALVSNTGTWLANLAVPFVLYRLTGSAVWTGLASLAQFAPMVILTPMAGIVADRFERRTVLLLTQTGMAASAFGMWMLWVLNPGNVQPLPILVLVALSGIFQGINLPSWQTFVNDLVPRSSLASAITLNSVQFNASRSVGPAIAGLILAMFGPSTAFLVNALTFVGVIVALLLIKAPHRVPILHASDRAHGAGFGAALRYVRRQPGIVVSILVSFVIGVLLNPILQFTVIFAESVFRVSPLVLGGMNAAFGLGSVCAAPFVAGVRSWTRAGITRVTLVVQGLGLGMFAISPNAIAASIALFIMGAAFLGAITSAITALQMIVTSELRGRVIAVRIMIYSASFPIGAMAQTALSDVVGPRAVVCGAAALLTLIGLLFFVGRPRRLLDRMDDGPDEPTLRPIAEDPALGERGAEKQPQPTLLRSMRTRPASTAMPMFPGCGGSDRQCPAS